MMTNRRLALPASKVRMQSDSSRTGRTDAMSQRCNHVQQRHRGKVVGKMTDAVEQHQTEQLRSDQMQLVIDL